MKKLLAILTLAAVVCASYAGVFAGNSADHYYATRSHTETLQVSGIKEFQTALLSVEVWNSTYNLAWTTRKYTRYCYPFASSTAVSASHASATRGYYAYSIKDFGGRVVDGDYGWETKRV